MIVHALVQWNVPITVDIPIGATSEEARETILICAVEDVRSKEPKIVKCTERMDVVQSV